MLSTALHKVMLFACNQIPRHFSLLENKVTEGHYWRALNTTPSSKAIKECFPHLHPLERVFLSRVPQWPQGRLQTVIICLLRRQKQSLHWREIWGTNPKFTYFQLLLNTMLWKYIYITIEGCPSNGKVRHEHMQRAENKPECKVIGWKCSISKEENPAA